MNIKQLRSKISEVVTVAAAKTALSVRSMSTPELEALIAEFERADAESWAKITAMTDAELAAIIEKGA